MSKLFKNQAEREKMVSWYERFKSEIPYTVESRTVTTTFGLTHLLVGGPASAPPLVIVHGAMASSAHALRELHPLLNSFRVYAIDIIGQSVKSEDRKLSVSNNESGEWLNEVVQSLSLDSFNLLGISWGGFISQRFASIFPEKIQKLALFVPAGIVHGDLVSGFSKMGWPAIRFRMFPTKKNLDKFLENLLSVREESWAQYLSDAFLAYKPIVSVPMLSKVGEFKDLAAPVYIWAGELDLSFPGKKLENQAKKLFPNLLKVEVIPGCRHCPPTTEVFRQKFTAELARFFES